MTQGEMTDKAGLNKPEIDGWWRQLKAKYGIDDTSKQVHQLASWRLPDGRILIRFGPRKLLIVEADRSTWWTPVPDKKQIFYPKEGYDASKRHVGAARPGRPRGSASAPRLPGQKAPPRQNGQRQPRQEPQQQPQGENQPQAVQNQGVGS